MCLFLIFYFWHYPCLFNISLFCLYVCFFIVANVSELWHRFCLNIFYYLEYFIIVVIFHSIYYFNCCFLLWCHRWHHHVTSVRALIWRRWWLVRSDFIDWTFCSWSFLCLFCCEKLKQDTRFSVHISVWLHLVTNPFLRWFTWHHICFINFWFICLIIYPAAGCTDKLCINI